MSHYYELRLLGTPPGRALAALGASPTVANQLATLAAARGETVLVTHAIRQGDLSDLLIRMSDLGIDVRELRRLPAHVTSRAAV